MSSRSNSDVIQSAYRVDVYVAKALFVLVGVLFLAIAFTASPPGGISVGVRSILTFMGGVLLIIAGLIG